MDYLLCSALELPATCLREPSCFKPPGLIRKLTLAFKITCEGLLLLLWQLAVPQTVTVAAEVERPVCHRAAYVHQVLAPVAVY